MLMFMGISAKICLAYGCNMSRITVTSRNFPKNYIPEFMQNWVDLRDSDLLTVIPKIVCSFDSIFSGAKTDFKYVQLILRCLVPLKYN
jgi:hypothetical protein